MGILVYLPVCVHCAIDVGHGLVEVLGKASLHCFKMMIDDYFVKVIVFNFSLIAKTNNCKLMQQSPLDTHLLCITVRLCIC